MKRKLSTLISLLTLATGVGNAQDISGMNIGYCQGEMGPFPSTADSYFADLSVQKQTWTSAAILLPAEKVQSLAGNQIREVHAALCSKLNVDSIAVWVSQSLDGPVLSSDTLPTPGKNWLTIGLSSPVEITDQMGALYVGYSYHQKSTSKALSTLPQGVSGYSCFVRSGNNEWADYSDSYTLCVEAMVYGDNLPKYDLTLESLAVQKNFVVDDGTLTITAQIRNSATATITGFDALCTVDGIDEVYVAHCDSVLAYQEVKTVQLTIRPEAIQSMEPAHRTLTVTIGNLAEGDDEMPADNTLSGDFEVTLHSFVRNVLLEEFTTEKCTNCPRVASFVHELMNSEEFAGRVNTCEHHAGYYTDSFTTQFDNDWTWFFDNLYAPGVMYDRYAAPGSVTAVSCPSTKSEMFNTVRHRLLQPAFVSLKVTATVDAEEQKIRVKVTGSRAKQDFTLQPARITVILTETNLAAIGQAGAGDGYIHYNVGRRVNSTWGDVIEWEGDDYTYECAIPYNQYYVMENLGILAFVHDYDPNDKTLCEVANSAAITAQQFDGGSEQAIRQVCNDAQQAQRRVDLMGRPVSAQHRGLSFPVR